MANRNSYLIGLLWVEQGSVVKVVGLAHAGCDDYRHLPNKYSPRPAEVLGDTLCPHELMV